MRNKFYVSMMTSSNGNIFRVTGHLCGTLMFILICAWTNGWVNNREAGDLRRYRGHYDVIVMPLCTLELITDGERIKAIGFIKQFKLNKWQRRIHSLCVENILLPPITLSERWSFRLVRSLMTAYLQSKVKLWSGSYILTLDWLPAACAFKVWKQVNIHSKT